MSMMFTNFNNFAEIVIEYVHSKFSQIIYGPIIIPFLTGMIMSLKNSVVAENHGIVSVFFENSPESLTLAVIKHGKRQLGSDTREIFNLYHFYICKERGNDDTSYISKQTYDDLIAQNLHANQMYQTCNLNTGETGERIGFKEYSMTSLNRLMSIEISHKISNPFIGKNLNSTLMAEYLKEFSNVATEIDTLLLEESTHLFIGGLVQNWCYESKYSVTFE